MAFGDPGLISVLDAVKNSFNSYPVDSVAAAAGVASLEDQAYFETRSAQVIATRERVTADLREMGFFATDSAANFMFISHAHVDAAELMAYLKERRILVRHFPSRETERYLRVSVGTDGEMDNFLDAVSDFLRKGKRDAF
jgi:histidinol-phosphate aminotransferase